MRAVREAGQGRELPAASHAQARPPTTQGCAARLPWPPRPAATTTSIHRHHRASPGSKQAPLRAAQPCGRSARRQPATTRRTCACCRPTVLICVVVVTVITITGGRGLGVCVVASSAAGGETSTRPPAIGTARSAGTGVDSIGPGPAGPSAGAGPAGGAAVAARAGGGPDARDAARE